LEAAVRSAEAPQEVRQAERGGSREQANPLGEAAKPND
jgi:hypothetical protein